jgi:hypothetical protein
MKKRPAAGGMGGAAPLATASRARRLWVVGDEELLFRRQRALDHVEILECGAGAGGTRFVRALSSFKEGRVVCEFEAPSKEALAAVYAQLGFPYDAIVEVDAVCDTGEGHVVTTDV